ncbi:MAG: aminopeptidase [Eubacteriaceae bacterium]|nr:aminopeptidase [Eubacteriaceae bacterium]
MKAKELEEKLTYKRKSAWVGDKEEIMAYSEGYKVFLGDNKTERECVKSAVELARAKGFKNIKEVLKEKKRLQPGDKVYKEHHGKCLTLFVIGKQCICKGMNVTASHIDSPRLDVKQVPLYEEGGVAALKTHYYGGIKKYQWTALPLAMHGILIDREGKKHTLSIGEAPEDPVFFISELLIHIAGDQMAKSASAAVSAEQLNVVVGHIPFEEEDAKERIKLNTLRILNEQFSVTEEDFLSAEIEFVPAGKPRDVGFDRGMITAYGHDDKVCAYPALTALLEKETPERTCVCVLADKEEVGSVGSTGLNGRFFENAVSEVVSCLKDNYNDVMTKSAMENSYVLSMDVNSCIDANYPEAFEKLNSAVAGYGTILTKYTGSRGKSGSSDANGEYLYKLRTLFNEAKVPYQTGEIGKTDLGGGGTVALYLAAYGANVVDLGVGVLSMHAPYELISKADLYATYKAADAFYGINE